jgi:uncharacterized cupin superfamily protein
MLRRMTPSSAQLTGGDLSVDILHTEDSVRLGDGTNLIGTFTSIGGVRSLPVDVKTALLSTKLTDSTGVDYAEIDDIAGEKALKVSVISTVGGGSGGTAATDSATFTATATQGTPLMGAYDDVSSDALAEQEMGIIRCTSARALHVEVQNTSLTISDGGSTISVDDGGSSLTVDGTVATTQSGTWNITNISGTVSLPTGAATESTLSSIKTSTELIDDAIVADNAGFTDGTTKLQMNGYIYDEVAGTALTENDAAAARIDSKRAQIHVLEDGSTRGRWATVTASNALKVDGSAVTQPVSGTVSVTGVATETTLSSALTSLQLIDDAIFTDDAAYTPASSKGLMIMAQADETTPDSVDEGDAGALRMTLTRFLKVQVADVASGISNAIPVSQSGTWNVGTVTTLTSITNAVTVAQATASSLKAEVVGSAAHDNASPGVPVMIAARANNANPTAVAAGDVTYLNADLAGRLVTTTSDRALVTQATGSQATTTEATMLAAGAANVFHDLTMLVLTNSHTTTAAQVQIRDATAGTIRFEQMIPANSGMVITFPTPFTQTSAANNWTIDLNAAVSTVYYTVQAIKRLA